MSDCFSGTAIPTDNDPIPCNGEYISTDCILTPSALVYLGISANATQTEINQSLVLALQQKDAQIQNLAPKTNITDTFTTTDNKTISIVNGVVVSIINNS